MVGHMFRLSRILASVTATTIQAAPPYPIVATRLSQQVDLECFPLSAVINHISTIILRSILKNLEPIR